MQKKFLIIYSLLIVFCFCYVLLPNKTIIFADSQNNNCSYHFYFNYDENENYESKISNCSFSSINNGEQIILSCNYENAQYIKTNLVNVYGEDICFDGTKEDGQNYINKLKAEIVLSEVVGNVFSVYAYSKSIKNYIFINDEKVNIQMSYNNNRVTIGSPLILGSY